MPELRKDPILSRWVIIATERAKRPSDLAVKEEEYKKGVTCPFDEGNEKLTPPEICAVRDAGLQVDSPGWKVRVVPNLYPALANHVPPSPVSPDGESPSPLMGEGIFHSMPGHGVHEVIVEGTRHEEQLADLSIDQIFQVIKTWKERILHHKKNPDIKYVQIFKNHGKRGGASLEHTHSQLVGMPFVPLLIEQELTGALDYRNKHDRCVYCDLLSQELKEGKRVIDENAETVMFNPFASRYPFETWLLPKKHESNFEEQTDEQLKILAQSIKKLLTKMNATLSRPPFNLILHTAPFQGDYRHYHWHIEFIPLTTSIAGLERGTETYINVVAPETAAEALQTS